MTNTSATLTWTKPENDGGSAVIAYHVKYAIKDSDKWTTATTKSTKATLEKLKTGTRYDFHVAAENEVGVGEWEVLGPLAVREMTVAPEADLGSIPRGTVNVREGGNIRVDIPFSGKPSPLLSWAKNRIPLKSKSRVHYRNIFKIRWLNKTNALIIVFPFAESERVMYERSGENAMLVIKDINRSDCGQYYLTMENSAGRKEASFSVNVFGTLLKSIFEA